LHIIILAVITFVSAYLITETSERDISDTLAGERETSVGDNAR
jgi:hypothetical protein